MDPLPTEDAGPSGARSRRADGPRWVALVRVAVLVLGVGYGLSLLPGVRPSAGFSPLFDGWLNNLFIAGTVLLVGARTALRRDDRLAWWFLTAGLAVPSHQVGASRLIGGSPPSAEWRRRVL